MALDRILQGERLCRFIDEDVRVDVGRISRIPDRGIVDVDRFEILEPELAMEPSMRASVVEVVLGSPAAGKKRNQPAVPLARIAVTAAASVTCA